MATEIADAYIALYTKMPGVKSDITRALGGSDVQGAVKNSGKSMGSLLTGAIGGAVALGLSTVVATVTRAIDGAIGRVDTMRNFPKIMANLGYSVDDATASISSMSDRLSGLPTSLDSMAGMVQQLAPITGSLAEATDLSLAFNNALLAGGKSVEIQANAMDQYTQMLSIGKVDMAAWRSLVTAMPGQMNQLSESLLGTGSSAMDLYAAMQDGTIGFDEFNDAVLNLNEDGVGAFASFEEQARSATDGIATSQANLTTAVTRGLANLIDKFQPQLVGILGGLTSFVNDAFKSIAELVDWAAENKDWLTPLAISVGTLTAAVVAWNVVSKTVAVVQAGVATVIGTVKAVQAAYAAGTYGLTAATYAQTSAGLASKVAFLAGAAATGVATAAQWVWTTATAAATGIQKGFTVAQYFARASTLQFLAATAASKIALVAGAVATGIATAAQWAFNAAVTANPIGLIIVAIGLLIGAIILLVMNWDTVVAFLSDVWNGFVEWFMGVMEGFAGWWGEVWDGFLGLISDVWGNIVAFVTAYINTVRTIITTVVNAIRSVWENIWNGIFSFFSGIWDGIIGAIQTVQGVFAKVFTAIANIIRGAFNGVVSVVRGVINSIIDAVNGVIGGINGVAGAIGDAIGINIRIGKIPRLADGAIISKRPGGILANIGEGRYDEAVVPLGGTQFDRLADALADAMGREQPSRGGGPMEFSEASLDRLARLLAGYLRTKERMGDA